MDDKTTIRSLAIDFMSGVLDVTGDLLVSDFDMWNSYRVETQPEGLTLSLLDGSESGEPRTTLSVELGSFVLKIHHWNGDRMVDGVMNTPAGFLDHNHRQMCSVIQEKVRLFVSSF